METTPSRAPGRLLGTALVVLAAAALTGCPWKKEIEQLKTEKAQLTDEKQKLQGELTATGAESAEAKATLDEVQKGLEELRTKELQVIRSSIVVAKEGKPRSVKRDELKVEIDTIRTAIKENLDKLAKLEKQKKESDAKAAGLERRVTTLERLVAELRRSLEEKEATIAELEVKVLNLSKTVETQAGVIKEKEGVIETQTRDLNTAYVAVAPKKELKERGLVEKKGSVLGLGGGWLRTGKFDPEVFRKIDVTTEKEFQIPAALKKVRVLSDHPKDSYELTETSSATCALKVTDPDRFWKGSKYLVVMLPD